MSEGDKKRQPPPPPVTEPETEGAGARLGRAIPPPPVTEPDPTLPAPPPVEKAPPPPPVQQAPPPPAPSGRPQRLELERAPRPTEPSRPAAPAPTTAKAAMDDLEAKGLFLVRTPPPPKSAVEVKAPPPPAGPSMRQVEEAWGFFAPDVAPQGPLGAPPPASPGAGLAPERERPVPPPEKPVERSYRAADMLYDEMTGQMRAETFTDFSRRFGPSTTGPRRLVEGIFPSGVVALFERRDWARLIDGFQRVIPQNPEVASAWAGLGACALAQEDVSTAARLFEQSLILNDDLLPGKLLSEVLPEKPELFLKLAEDLGARGRLEASQDLCNRVSLNLDYPDSLRKRAQNVRRRIRHQYFLKRGEVDPERPAAGEGLGPRLRRLAGVSVVVLILLGVAAWAAALAYGALQVDQGSNRLSQGLYLLDRLREQDPSVAKRGKPEDHLEAAVAHFDRALKWNPGSARAAFRREKAATALVEVGKARRTSLEPWSRARTDRALRLQKESRTRLQAMKLAPDVLEEEKSQYEALRSKALDGEVLGY